MRALAVALLLSACAPLEGQAPDVEATGASGALHLAVTLTPSPPQRGVSSARFIFTDAAGAPLEGLTITVQPWMVQHGHGTSVQPTVVAQGKGVFEVTQLALPMPGLWQLRTTVSGAMADVLSPTLDLP